MTNAAKVIGLSAVIASDATGVLDLELAFGFSLLTDVIVDDEEAEEEDMMNVAAGTVALVADVAVVVVVLVVLHEEELDGREGFNGTCFFPSGDDDIEEDKTGIVVLARLGGCSNFDIM